ncbi:MAG: MBL fold metallo-hydrolase [Cytophagales bacterium]|nr:MBL fold metallo-hydrolase [Rhizobacter sp.]
MPAVANASLPFVQTLADGIHVIDTGFHRPNFDAAYLLVEDGRAAFIDTGTTHSVPRLLSALSSQGLAIDAVDWVIVTHVHLDHAGGAGALMKALPNARLLVHPRGERHMVNPAALLAGATAVYGADEVARSYGEVPPIAAERVVTSTDGQTVYLGGRPLQLLDTPGHARHHHCIWDERSRGFFTGDTFGLSYREFDTARGPWLLPTTTPVQFDPEALRNSVRRILSYVPERLYLTHYGCVENVPPLGEMMLTQIDELVALAEPLRHANERHAQLRRGLTEIYLRRVREHGCTLTDAEAVHLLASDIELNAQGLAVWLDGGKPK